MAKKIKKEDLSLLLKVCFNKALNLRKIPPLAEVEIEINSIYAQIIFDPQEHQMLETQIKGVFEEFEGLLEKYAGINLTPIRDVNRIIIQVAYEIVE